ncbi:MAG TPA: SigE family RNA polymerase sigma factor [Actinomycetota bacterium]
MARLRSLGPGEVAAAGDPLRTAFEQHSGTLLRLCALLLGRREGAEDLMQESFVRLAPKVSRLEPEIVWPYLRRIAVNLANDRFRRMALDFRARTQQVPGPSESPDAAVAQEVWEAVRRLPARQRACVVLRYYEDMTEKQIAEALGCSVGTVKSSASRALDHLRKELGDEA